MKKLTAGIAAGAVALGLGGCVAFDGEIEGKQVSGKKVQVKFTVCNDGGNDTCVDNDGRRRGDSDQETKVLVAFRLPAGTKAPKTFKSKGDVVKFTKSNSYTNQMNNKAPRNDVKEFWAGYVSKPLVTQASRGTIKVRFELPKSPGKAFRYRPVVGFQDGAPRPNVRCNGIVTDPETQGDGDQATDWTCVDDPSAMDLEKNLKIELD